MTFTLIDQKHWHRKEYFEHYLQQQTTFSMTNNITITSLIENLKDKKYKFYPAFIYMVTKVVNSHKEFRTNFNAEGELGYWSEICPAYTIFDGRSHTFSCIWTPVSDDFASFQARYLKDIEIYNGTGRLFPKKPMPENHIPISMVPWSSFTAFNLNIGTGRDYLLPIITAGKYSYEDDEVLLPVSLQIHHAVCDGYHAGVFMNELQALADNSGDWV
ncbi:type A chloramphenicol O-acetyltransferase [Rossellomorea aquimaris]|uniref:Chloramphenicol acetyltransferase n=1 Tax=Rossellomorea aquimaris TaxID=189382 RepID=A0A1J6W5A1_9BACI|nr:type A chloramphenicol O-acetyltransferase [Rossellomorea aquimaris]OIU72813.1 type A chloramphenicol O-acetyltransferase [Rossellomorea aquimaris]